MQSGYTLKMNRYDGCEHDLQMIPKKDLRRDKRRSNKQALKNSTIRPEGILQRPLLAGKAVLNNSTASYFYFFCDELINVVHPLALIKRRLYSISSFNAEKTFLWQNGQLCTSPSVSI